MLKVDPIHISAVVERGGEMHRRKPTAYKPSRAGSGSGRDGVDHAQSFTLEHLTNLLTRASRLDRRRDCRYGTLDGARDIRVVLDVSGWILGRAVMLAAAAAGEGEHGKEQNEHKATHENSKSRCRRSDGLVGTVNIIIA